MPARRAAVFLHVGTSLLLSAAAATAASRAVTPPPPLLLPTFDASEAGPAPARENWRHARAGAYEIISQLSDPDTRPQVTEVLFVHAFIASICPEPLWTARYSQPCLAIFHSEPNKDGYLGFLGASDAVLAERVRRPSAASSRKFLRGREQTALVHLGDFYLNTHASGAAIIHNIFQQFAPRPPVWFRVGVGNLVCLMDPGLIWDPHVVLTTPDFRFAPLPLQAMFDQALPPPEALTIDPTALRREAPLAVWHHQIALFIHYGLWGDGGRHRDAFARFVHRTCTEPATEELLRECLGLGYDEMLARLRDYSTSHAFRAVDLAALRKRLLADLPRLAFRPAAAADVARIKAEGKLMSGHGDAARSDLIHAYLRGGATARDPQLLGSLGLRELAARRTDRARPLLEAAAAAQVPRPMVYLELARLRLAEIAPDHATRDAPLVRPTLEPVLSLLRTARALKPPFAEIHRLNLDLLARLDGPLTPDDRAALDEAARDFPQDAALQRAVVEIRQARGSANLDAGS